MPDDTVQAVGGETPFTARLVQLAPSLDQQRNAEEDEGEPDHHLDQCPEITESQKGCPEMAAHMQPGDLDPQEGRQHVNGEREPIHLGIEGHDEGLHEARPTQLSPPLGRRITIEEPRGEHDHDSRQPPCPIFAVWRGFHGSASLHQRLCSVWRSRSSISRPPSDRCEGPFIRSCRDPCPMPIPCMPKYMTRGHANMAATINRIPRGTPSAHAAATPAMMPPISNHLPCLVIICSLTIMA